MLNNLFSLALIVGQSKSVCRWKVFEVSLIFQSEVIRMKNQPEKSESDAHTISSLMTMKKSFILAPTHCLINIL
jgi:hypothetical protein